MNTLIKYLKPYFKRMTFGLCIKALGTITELLLPYILAMIIDDIIPAKNINLVLFWGTMMLVFSTLTIILNIWANRMASMVAKLSAGKMRHDLFAKTSYLSAHSVDRITISSLESRLTSDTYNVHRMIGIIQRMGIRAPMMLIGGILITLKLEPYLSMVLLATLPFITYLVYRKAVKGIPLYGQAQKASDDMVAVVRENASGIRIIKALNKIDYEKDRYDGVNTKLVDKEKYAGNFMAITNPMMNLFLNMGLIGVILVGAYRVNLGLSEAGKMIAFMTYFTLISNALLSISRLFMIISKGIASADRIGEILDEEDEIQVLNDPSLNKIEEGIVFDHVSFGYGSKMVIRNINIHLDKGETLGIIGATGSGKSTLIQLLMRFYDVNEGAIRIDGIDIRNMEQDALKAKFGSVMQNDFIYCDSIKENIRFGSDVDEDTIWNSLDHAQGKDFVKDMEERLDSHLTTKGTNVSGGQRQRILLARAFVKNPEILILDDSSSALDYRTDANLRRSISQNYKEKTCIIITQRISSIMHADHIIVLDKGEIVDEGKHEYLLEHCEIYRSINDSQLGGDLLDE